MRFLLVTCLCLSLVGCSAIGDLVKSEDGQRVYGGTRKNASLVSGEDGYSHGGVGPFCLGVLDFPFSLALDTGFIPVTLIVALFRTGPEK